MMMILRKNEVVTGLLSLIYQTIEFATAFRGALYRYFYLLPIVRSTRRHFWRV